MDSADRRRSDRPTRWLLLPAMLKAGAHVLTAARYPLHADEMYHIVCGRHPAWSYPDHPPLVPWIAGLIDATTGPNPLALRFAPAVMGGLIVYLTGWMAWRFGAERRGQLLAAGAVLLSPLFLLSNSMLQTVSFDQLAWILMGVLLIRILGGGDERNFVAAGAAFALGVWAKLTILAWGLAVFAGLALTSSRTRFRRAWPWIGAACALLAAVPVLMWQARHAWPVIEFIRESRADDATTPWSFLGMQMAMSGPLVGTLLLSAGFVALLRAPALRVWRPVGVAIALVWFVYLAGGGKPYYVGPTHPVLIAAGATVAGWFLAQRRRAWTVAVFALLGSQVAMAPAFLPILPVDRILGRLDDLPHDDWNKMFGWTEVVEQLAETIEPLSPTEREGLRILTDNYGLASAIDVLGPAYDLPPAISGHNGYAFWQTEPALDPLLVVGYTREMLARHFGSVRSLGRVRGSERFESPESGEPIFLCTGRKTPSRELWLKLRHFD